MNNASKARADKLMPEKEVFKVDLLLGSMTSFMYMPKMRCRLPRKTAAESPFGASARCHGKLESIYVGRVFVLKGFSWRKLDIEIAQPQLFRSNF